MDGWICDVCHRHRMERYWQMDGWISDVCHRHRMGEYWQMDSFYYSYLLAEEVIPCGFFLKAYSDLLEKIKLVYAYKGIGI